jgi:hypothetical protein
MHDLDVEIEEGRKLVERTIPRYPGESDYDYNVRIFEKVHGLDFKQELKRIQQEKDMRT